MEDVCAVLSMLLLLFQNSRGHHRHFNHHQSHQPVSIDRRQQYHPPQMAYPRPSGHYSSNFTPPGPTIMFLEGSLGISSSNSITLYLLVTIQLIQRLGKLPDALLVSPLALLLVFLCIPVPNNINTNLCAITTTIDAILSHLNLSHSLNLHFHNHSSSFDSAFSFIKCPPFSTLSRRSCV